MGRFLSKDPIQVGESALAQNPYIYTANNPLTHIDPSGKYIETALDVAGLAYDINAFRKNRSWSNTGSLIWSAAAVAIPIVPGSYAGKAVTSTAKVAKATKITKNVEKAENGLNAGNRASGSSGGLGAGKPFANKIKEEVKARASVCRYCGKKPEFPEIDHIIPKSRNGNNSFENAQLTCRTCNRSKGNRSFPKNFWEML